MEVNFSNFFSHLIFQPFDAKTKRDQKIALIASIACGIFSVGFIHLVCAFVKYVARPMLGSEGKNPEISSLAKKHLSGEENKEGIPLPRPKKSLTINEEKSSIADKDPIQSELNTEQPIEKKVIGNTSIEMHQGDLLDQPVQAIVSSPNPIFNGRGGLNYRISGAAGSSVSKELEAQLKEKGLVQCEIGDAYLIGSGRLSEKGIRNVIHTVGPTHSTENGANLLHHAYYNSLLRAHEAKLTSIAFPPISIGTFGYSPGPAAEISFKALVQFCKEHPETTLTEIRLVFWVTDNQQVTSFNPMREMFNQ